MLNICDMQITHKYVINVHDYCLANRKREGLIPAIDFAKIYGYNSELYNFII